MTQNAAIIPFQAAALPEKVEPAEATSIMATEASARVVAETQAMMLVAKRFPRSQMQAMDRIIQACTRPTLASKAVYTYARGGTNITGPSIRLAEAIAREWGNIQFGIRELEQKNGESTMEAYAWDMETNTRQVKVFTVKHMRYTRKGSYKLEDPRDIYEATANQGARRVRACILGIIPGDVVDAAVDQCTQTMTTALNLTPEYIKKMLEMFGKYGVTKAQIEKRIQRRIDAITPALMVNLGNIYNSIRDGMSVAADWFEAEEAAKPDANGKGSDALKDKLRGKVAEKKPEAKPETDEEQKELL